MHLVNNSIVGHGDDFGRYNPELGTEHYMWFWQQYQRWLWEEHFLYVNGKKRPAPAFKTEYKVMQGDTTGSPKR